jgi:pyruvate dehydrogenase E2 component (dihydrolipoamide acetyltransferase)
MEDIFVPAAGMAMEDVLLSEWLKQPGDEVKAGEPVAVVETDKATVELSPTGAGRLGRHLFQVGARVKAGATVTRLLDEGEVDEGEVGTASPDGTAPGLAQAGPAPSRDAASAAPPTREPHQISPRQRRARAQAASASPPPFRGFSAPATAGQPAASAAPAGRAVPDRVASSERVAPSPAPAGFRGAIADAVASSWSTIPHFSVGRDIDGEALLAALEQARRAAPGVTVTDYLLIALADALVSLGEAGDVGLAVATDAGVIIPVLRGIAGRPREEVTRMRRDAVDRARTRRLIADDATTPFATLSNLGAMGVSWFTGVIPLGQTALVTIGELAARPVVEGRGIAIRTTCSVTVTADHRRYDGADSARLLGLFARAVEGIEEGNHR